MPLHPPAGHVLKPLSRSPAAEPRVCVQAREVRFGFTRSSPILKGVTLELRTGEVTMILGRSGSGKTTLLKVLNGLLRPQGGTIHLRLPGGSGGSPPAGRVAYIPQTLGLVRSTTALENTLTGALSRASTMRSLVRAFPRPIVQQARETLASLGLADKTHEPVCRLSGGERQRVAIARALMQDPFLILADEFVSQLDPITTSEILDMMRGIARSGVGLLVTTHETGVAADYGDRIVIMRSGEIVHDSPGGSLSTAQMLELLR